MKRALVLSGGGSRGQYEVGGYFALANDLGFTYDIVCGVSFGGLLAAFICQYTLGNDRFAARDAGPLFGKFRDSDVYKSHFFGKMAALWKASIFDASPLEKTITKHVDLRRIRESGRELRIGATSLSTGEYRVFTQHDAPLHQIIYATAAFPIAFQPARFGGAWWSDGGVRTVTPVRAAIDAGADEIHVLMTPPKGSSPSFDPEPNTLDAALRTIELMNDQIIEDDLAKALLWNRLIECGVETEKRRIPITIVRPNDVLNEDSLRFDPDEATRLQDQGYRDVLETFALN